MIRWRPLLEIPALIAAALACAWASNHLAGPTRRLAWRPQPIVPMAAPAPTPAPIKDLPKAVAAVPAAPVKTAIPVQASKPTTPSPEWDPAALLARFPELKDQPYTEVDGDEARWLWSHGALFLDARRTDVYTEGHIAGAKSLPVWEDDLAAKIAALQRDKADPLLPTAVYCAGGDCEDSKLLAQKLWMAGFHNLRVYSGGFPEWASRHWPVAKGATP